MKKSLRTVIMVFAVMFGALLTTGISSKAEVQNLTVQQTGAGEQSVSLSWSAALGSDVRYYIMFSNDGQNWVEQGSTSGTQETVGRLSAGSVYHVMIIARQWNNDTYKYDIEIGRSGDVTVSTLVKVPAVEELTQTDATNNSISMSWKAVSGATGYDVYRYNSWDNYTKLGDTASTNFTVTGLGASQAFEYFVIAKQRTATGQEAMSDEFKRVTMKTIPNKVLTVAMTNYFSSIRVAYYGWTDVDKADGYEFQLLDNKGKKLYSTLTTSTSCRIDPFKQGVFIRARARAYIEVNGQKKYGPWSGYNYNATATKLSAKRSKNGKKITLTWKKISGAAGYTVYISTKSNSGFKKVKTLGAKKTKYTITKYGKKKLKKSKRYYIRVEYLTKSGGKKVKSSIVGTFSGAV